MHNGFASLAIFFAFFLDERPARSYCEHMSKTKRPSHRPGDAVTLSTIKSSIPAYDGKPPVLRDTVLRVSSVTGTGSKRNPFHVVATDGTHFWHLEPDDVSKVEPS